MKQIIVIIFAVVIITLTGCKKEEKEEAVSVKDLPQAVVDAVKAKYPDAEIEEAEKDVEDGSTVYDIEIILDGKEIEIEVTPEGKILEEDDEGDDKDDDNEEDGDEEDKD